MPDDILVSRDGPVTTITLNRPEKRNALTTGMIARLHGEIERVAADGDTRVLVLRSRQRERDALAREVERGVSTLNGIGHAWIELPAVLHEVERHADGVGDEPPRLLPGRGAGDVRLRVMPDGEPHSGDGEQET